MLNILRVAGILATGLLFLAPKVAAEPFFQVISGQGTLNRNASLYRAQKGVRLYEGDVLYVPGRIQILGDYGSFVSTIQKGRATLTILRREGCGVRDFIEFSGKLWVTARPRTCSTSTVQFQSQANGVAFDIWRGQTIGKINRLVATSLSVNLALSPDLEGVSATFWDRDNATILKVEYGVIVSSSAGVSVPVSGHEGNITLEGQPPGQPIKIDSQLRMIMKLRKVLNGVYASASVNPLNTVSIQGVQFTPVNGEVETFLRYPIGGNALFFSVSDGEKTRVYFLPLPTRK
jgi:hypothetical protein